MSRVVVEDDGGDTMNLIEHNGKRFPNFPHIDSITKIREVPVRDDDIFICAFPKSGTHWVWEIARLLVRGEAIQDSIEKGSNMLEFVTQSDIAALPSPRILNTHHEISSLPPDVINKRCKIINVIRNPKDAILSYYHYARGLPHYNYKGKWENYVKFATLGKFSFGSWFDFTIALEETKRGHPGLPLLTLYYEDMKEDPVPAIKRVNEFLGTNRSPEFIQTVAELTSFSSMKQKKTNKGTYRKGQVGDWKNWFTVAQNEWFEKLYKEKMADFDLKIRFTLPETPD